MPHTDSVALGIEEGLHVLRIQARHLDGVGVVDQIAIVRGCRIKPVENGLRYRSLTVKSPQCRRIIFRYLPVPS